MDQKPEIEPDAPTVSSAEAPPEATTSPSPPRSETRYPLAFDLNGNPLQVPAHAVAWRVRRGGGKRGRPRNVFDTTTGRQLEIALGASIEDLASTNVPPDRYLLYPVDEQGSIIPGIVAVTEVTEIDSEDEGEAEHVAAPSLPKDPWLAVLASFERTLASYEKNFAGQYEVINRAMDSHTKSLDRAVSGYAPVRPVMPAPLPPAAPMVIEQAPAAPAAPAADALSSVTAFLSNPAMLGNIMMFVQQAVAMFKSATAASAGAAAGIPGVAP